MDPAKVMILGPNRLFLHYISSTLPDLGVEQIEQSDFLDWWRSQVKDPDKTKYACQSPAQLIGELTSAGSRQFKKRAYLRNRLKGSFFFAKVLAQYVHDIETASHPKAHANLLQQVHAQLRHKVKQFEQLYAVELKLDDAPYGASEALLSRWYADYQYLPFMQRRQRIIKNVQNDRQRYADHLARKLKFLELKNEDAAKFTRAVEQTMLQGIAAFTAAWKPLQSIELYFNLVTDSRLLSNYLSGMTNLSPAEIDQFAEDCTALRKNHVLESSDLAGIWIIDDMLHQGALAPNGKKPYDYLVIDEAQDYNQLEYYVLSNIVKKGHMTILGDLGQSIFDYRSIRTWEDVRRIVGSDAESDISYVELSSTYRSTKQITDYSNSIIRPWSEGKYRLSKSFGREGHAPVVILGLDLNDRIQEIASQVGRLTSLGYRNIAIITRYDGGYMYALLDRLRRYRQDISALADDSSIYEGGTIIIPALSSKGLEFDAVIIEDSAAYRIEENDFERKLLYVATSRALHELVIL